MHSRNSVKSKHEHSVQRNGPNTTLMNHEIGRNQFMIISSAVHV